MAEALVVRNLSKRFGGLRAVQDLSFAVAEGETVALIGPNGAGKTTSFHLITGYHRADAGSIIAFGRELAGVRPYDICAHGLARTFQVARPFGKMTVLANVMTGALLRDRRLAAARAKAQEAIDFVGLALKAETPARDLTTIDQRRLELARALATDPQVLLLDEIGAGLTDEEAAELVRTIRELRRQRVAIVWIEHIVHVLVQVVERLVAMDSGRVIAEGDPEAVMRNAAVIDAYLGTAV